MYRTELGIFIGNKRLGNKGAFFSALGTCLPSFLCILAIALVFQQFRENVYVEHFFRGIRPAVVALIAIPVFRMAKSAKINRYNIWIPIVSAFLIWMLGVSPIFIVLAAGVSGYVYGKYLKEEDPL